MAPTPKAPKLRSWLALGMTDSELEPAIRTSMVMQNLQAGLTDDHGHLVEKRKDM